MENQKNICVQRIFTLSPVYMSMYAILPHVLLPHASRNSFRNALTFILFFSGRLGVKKKSTKNTMNGTLHSTFFIVVLHNMDPYIRKNGQLLLNTANYQKNVYQ